MCSAGDYCVAKATPATDADRPPAVPQMAPAPKTVPGTTLRCLEDPLSTSFPTWTPPPTPVSATPGGSGVGSRPAPRYRVLEAPGMASDVFYQPAGSPYKILEDPGTGAASSTSPSTAAVNRSLASDVLEKARNRFDRFWGAK